MSTTVETRLNPPQPCNWGRKAVQEFASEVATSLNFHPKGDIRSVVTKFGGKISVSDWDSPRQTGAIEVSGPSDFTIFLSPHSGERRARFTIAHELGHYFLHSQAGKSPIYVRRDGSGQVEWEANWFAAGFLIPDAIFHEKLALDWKDSELAEFFGVSEEVVQIRRRGI